MTAKLVISFVQVISGSFSSINIDWPRRSHNLLNVINVNPLNALQSTYMCSKDRSHDPYFAGLLLHFLTPFIFLVILLLVASVVRVLAVKSFASTDDGVSKTAEDKCPVMIEGQTAAERVDWSIWNTSGKLYLWFCLIAYPSLSSR